MHVRLGVFVVVWVLLARQHGVSNVTTANVLCQWTPAGVLGSTPDSTPLGLPMTQVIVCGGCRVCFCV